MKRSQTNPSLVLITVGLVLICAACGGGGGGGTTPPPPPPPATLTITTDSILPPTLMNHSYTTTLQATGGSGSVHWSIAAVAPTVLFVDGLTIDANTGVLSGTANFAGTAGFVATATDSASHTATKGFSVTAYGPLQSNAAQTVNTQQYAGVTYDLNNIILGGVPPLNFTVTSGALPAGARLDRSKGQILGSPTVTGSFPVTVTVQDSFSPAEVVTQQLTVNVSAPPFNLSLQSFPSKLLLNRPFSGAIVATGGVPPYQFSMIGGQMPPGLEQIDPSAGTIIGTPNATGGYSFLIKVTDSSSPVQQAQWWYNTIVSQPIGRNDSPATATPITNGFYQATISPYIDPPNGTPFAADHDYYKLTSVSGATVHVETTAKRNSMDDPLDTVLEIVDGNGVRQATCNVPTSVSTAFSSSCMNDDMAPGVQDSALDYKVPGAPSTPTTFYIHVLDWSGNARPDMVYSLQVSGAVDPLKVNPLQQTAATRGNAFSGQFTASNGTAPITWSVVSGNLPPGLTMSNSGAISGMATTDGTYSFTVQAADASSPAQTATLQASIQVAEPVKISSSATFPPACVNQPYSYQITTTGGVPPVTFTFMSMSWVAVNLSQSTGLFSGTPQVTGTFNGSLGAVDAAGSTDGQQVSLTVTNCP